MELSGVINNALGLTNFESWCRMAGSPCYVEDYPNRSKLCFSLGFSVQFVIRRMIVVSTNGIKNIVELALFIRALSRVKGIAICAEEITVKIIERSVGEALFIRVLLRV